MSQVPLNLPHRTALGREDFLVAPNNAEAVALIDRWPDWSFPLLVITGEEGSGKTHLAEVWRERSGAVLLEPGSLGGEGPGAPVNIIIDGLDGAFDQRWLFALINRMSGTGSSLLITARRPPAYWDISLPDLATRLGRALLARLGPPDDALLTALIVKLFADRGIKVSVDVVDYLVSRLPRSCAAAAKAVAVLDHESLVRKSPISVPLARGLLPGLTEGAA